MLFKNLYSLGGFMKHLIPALLLAHSMLTPCMAQAQDSLDNLDSVSLESLGNIVTSVSKRPEDSFRAAAAIHVITSEDIKLSGATHIAEVLRGTPGLEVARFDSSNWAITARGFNGFHSNKMLVVVDGRTIYSPLFSLVYWDIQNLPLSDIERIEIIRGPGASLWGTNAVNGIINIITKKAAETQEVYINQIIGTQYRSITDLRYGGKVGDELYYRVFAKYDNRAATRTDNGRRSGNNEWESGKLGFRADWSPSSAREVTLQGDVYRANVELDLNTPSLSSPTGYNFSHDMNTPEGLNLLAKWEEKHSDTLESTFQSYFDYQNRSYSALEQNIYTFDLDYQTAWTANDTHEVLWGGGARSVSNDLTGSSSIMVTHPETRESIFNLFVQDQIALVPKELYFTLGTKLEHNTFTGFEPEPSARIAWYPDEKQTVWAAVSQAVRIPSIGERSLTINALPVAPATIAQLQYNRDFASEDLVAYEIGHRIKPNAKWSFDSTAFINDYRKLTTYEPQAPIAVGGGAYIPLTLANLGSGHAYGFETSATWEVASNWNLLANYSYLNLILDKNSSQDPTFMGQEERIPHNQAMLRSEWFLPNDVRLIGTGYYVDSLPQRAVESYVRFDAQAIWQPMNGLELALVGQNLLEASHAEFNAPPDGFTNYIPRAVYGRATIRY
jgi:iron complex outermembrane receptor protein